MQYARSCLLSCWVIVLLMGLSTSMVKAAEEMKASDIIDETRYVYALIRTSLGDIFIELDTVKAPVTCANFLQYGRSRFYDSTIFHRVISGFMIQGGGFTIDMVRKPPREPIINEWQNGLKNERGTIAMARLGRQPNSATSQFFINVKDNISLDQPRDGAGYAVFGRVVTGMDIVDRIRRVETGSVKRFKDVPRQPVIIETVARLEGEALDLFKDRFNDSRRSSVSPLHRAIAAGDGPNVRELLEKGADVNARDTLLMAPLHKAAKNGFADIAEILIKSGADLNAVDDNHETPLHLATYAGNSVIVDLLLKNGAEVAHRDTARGWTPLFNAVDRKFPAIAKKLIDFGADLNMQDHQGQTPLHLAAGKDYQSMVRLLIEHGSDVNAVDREGRTPLAIARHFGYNDIADIIMTAGGRE